MCNKKIDWILFIDFHQNRLKSLIVHSYNSCLDRPKEKVINNSDCTISNSTKCQSALLCPPTYAKSEIDGTHKFPKIMYKYIYLKKAIHLVRPFKGKSHGIVFWLK